MRKKDSEMAMSTTSEVAKKNNVNVTDVYGPLFPFLISLYLLLL